MTRIEYASFNFSRLLVWEDSLRLAAEHLPFGVGQGNFGIETYSTGKLKMVLTNGVEIRDLYRLAAEQNVQIRRLDYKKDSLQDIFLKAMESPNGAAVEERS